VYCDFQLKHYYYYNNSDLLDNQSFSTEFRAGSTKATIAPKYYHYTHNTKRQLFKQQLKVVALKNLTLYSLNAEQFSDKAVPVLETAEAGDGLEHVGVHGVHGGDDVCLDHLHHGQLQLQLPLSSSCHPRMPIDLR